MNLLQYRIKYGECFVSVFDDLIIPWRKLTLLEWLNFNNSPSLALIVAEIEDVIFDLCVLDITIKENYDFLPAGVISSVANQILVASGPETTEQINQSLGEARVRMDGLFYSFIPFVCSVFPAYTPEHLLALDFDTFMDRVALAERRLIQLRVIPETGFDITGVVPAEAPVQQKQTPARTEKISRKLGDLKPGVVISAQQMSSTFVEDGNTGHELSDKSLWQADAVSGLEHIYPEYFKLMSEGKKITSETIHSVKGSTSEDVKKNYGKYANKFKSGEIAPPPAKYLIADKMDGQSNSKPGKKKRAVITRVKK